MKITLTREQIKKLDLPDVKVGRLTKEQSKIIAEVLFDLICNKEKNFNEMELQ